MTNTEEQEIWKTYPEYPWIEASNLGRIRTKDRYVKCKNGSKRFYKGHILKQWDNGHGYMCVAIYSSGKIADLYVHRIVATCFIPNPNGYLEVNHKDNNPRNNAVSNLEWCTRQYNSDYKKNFGTTSAEVLGQPAIAVNPETSEVFWFESQSEAARQLGVNRKHVNSVIKGTRNKTGGYWFTNANENAVENARKKFGDDIAKKVEKLMNEHGD